MSGRQLNVLILLQRAAQSEDLYLEFKNGFQMVFEEMWLNEGTLWDYRWRESFPGLRPGMIIFEGWAEKKCPANTSRDSQWMMRKLWEGCVTEIKRKRVSMRVWPTVDYSWVVNEDEDREQIMKYGNGEIISDLGRRSIRREKILRA